VAEALSDGPLAGPSRVSNTARRGRVPDYSSRFATPLVVEPLNSAFVLFVLGVIAVSARKPEARFRTGPRLPVRWSYQLT